MGALENFRKVSGQKRTGGRDEECVCVCGLTLLVTLEFGNGGVPVEDGPVEAQLVV